MKLRWLALALVVIMVFSLCAACKSDKLLTDEEAQKAAVAAAGLTIDQVSDLHTHFNIVDGTPQFQIHFNCNGQEYEYLIHGRTGDVISGG